ncbi:autotransporter outer membrane beta-barrel domain-containing protein [Phascolarctobacterium faecium]|uniref:autotransporter outer membrane beta-barrel domain-containing protein n=1 Tax=Phascolarctobacterium faecium TaxID=33025 RepID=UPI003FEDEE6F
MKNHKNLSKQELMTRQDIPCVQLGGKFVSLDSKTEARQSVSRKKQAEQLLATVVMGMNLVNTVAPLAVLATAEQKMSVVPQPLRSEAEPLDYAVLPQLADVVDRAIFARTEAADYDGNASVTDMVDGDSQTITAGQSGTVSTMSGGEQNISSGGTGTVSTMSGGEQNISSGGTGTISTMSGGNQNIYGGSGTVIDMDGGGLTISSGGSGTVIDMDGGGLAISSGGNGTVSTMSAGWQEIYDGGTGTVSTMLAKYGYQGINGGTGTVNVMSSGAQYVNGGTGTVSTMSGGSQTIKDGGTGTVSTMLSGTQSISNGGVGSALGVLGGQQLINSGGIGYVESLTSNQVISSGGTGIIETITAGETWTLTAGQTGIANSMSGSQVISSGAVGSALGILGGQQLINSGGIGYVESLTSNQVISSGGTGIIETITAGEIWTLTAGQTGIANSMSGGTQVMSGGTGTIDTMNNGLQWLFSGGTGTIDVMHDGMQDIRSGGTGTIDTMNAGSQFIASGGTGTVDIMSGGSQTIVSGAAGTINTMHDGMQAISSGCTGTVSAMNGGTQAVNSGGTALDTVIAGGTQLVSGGAVISGATLSAGIQQVYDGTNLNNITFAGGTQAVMSGAAVSGMQVANGVQSIASGGSAADTVVSAGGSLQLSSGGIVSDLTLTSGTLALTKSDGGSLNINGTLTANDAVINMTDSSVNRGIHAPAYETLNIDKLSGSGTTFVMDTDLAGETNSDKITITDADAGTHYVQIKDLSKLNGIEVTGAHQQLLITDASGKLTFEGKEFNAGGLWDIDPTLAKQGNDWYLTKIAKTANNDTRVLLDAADNSYALWRNTNDSLRSRLGALASGSEQSDGIWARTQAGSFSGDNYEGRYNLYQLGFDQAADAKSVYGAAVDYGDGTGSYDNGSGKDKLKSFSLYGVWTGDNGAYTNVTARYGMVSTDLESYGDYPDKAEYKQHAYSVSVEYGKRITLDKNWFIEPQAQFTLGRLGSISYTTDRGANGYIEGMNSAIGRIGFVMGQKITGGSDIYLKADLLHEFAGERDLQLTSDAGGTNDSLTKHNDYGDTWFELGLGANIKVSKAASIYGEVERGFGGDINKKWSVNGGVRFTF